MEPTEQVAANMAKLKAAAARRGRPTSTVISSTAPVKKGLPNQIPRKFSDDGSSVVNSAISSFALGASSSTALGASTNTVSTPLSGASSSSLGSSARRESETEGQERLRKKLEHVGIAPTVDVVGTAVVARAAEPQAKLDMTDLRSFLGQPPPQVGMIQCFVVREKPNKYFMYLEENDVFLLASMKRGRQKTSNYIISLAKNDLNRESGNFYGKLRSNFVGTGFVIYDKGEKPSEKNTQSGMNVRQEMGAILYEKNILGSKGPRKMTVLLPGVEGGKRAVFRPEKEEDSLVSRFRARSTDEILVLKNKEPTWHEELRAFVLNFNGRATKSSVKNFQMVSADDPNKVLIQFGKVDANKYTLDFQYPVCGMQAFGVALSAFDGKLACE